MISILIVLAMMLVGAIALGIVAGRKTEECIPIVFLGTIVLLYVFYCFDLLIVGRFFVYAAFALIALAAVFFISKKRFKGKVFEQLITPGVIFFLALSVFFICYLSKMKPSVWDELRLWAAAPKALHFSERLQVGAGSLLYTTMQSYPPGMSLITYFFMAFSKTYFDGAAFIVECIFMCAMVTPCFKKMGFGKWKFIIPEMIVFLLIPVVLSINGELASGDWAYYYLSLFIDPCLGIVMGSALFSALSRPFGNWFDTVYFSLLLFVLPCMKNSGAMFAAMVFAGALILYLLDKNYRRLGFLRAFISLAGIAVSYFSWQLIINTRGTGEFIDFNVSGFTGEKLLNVFTGITSWGYLPFLWIILFLLGVDIFITLFFKDLKKKDALVIILIFFIICLFFFYGYTSHYGLRLSSIHRYTQSFTFASFVYLFMRGVCIAGSKNGNSCKAPRKARAINGYLTFLVQLVLLFAAIILLLGYQKRQYTDKYTALGEDYVSGWASTIAGQENGEVADCYLLLGGDTLSNSQAHETFYYQSIGSGMRIKNIWCDRYYNEAVTEVDDDAYLLAMAFGENLAENDYKYVLIGMMDEDMSRVFKILDDKISLKDGMVLKVVTCENPFEVGFEIID